MLNRTKYLSLGLATAILLSLAVSSASARRLATSSSTFRGTWANLVFEETSTLNVSCPVTLEGSFHSTTLSKVADSLIGYITRAVVAEASCRGGRARAKTETLPWHVRYESFVGTLPNITELKSRIVGATFTVEPTGSGLACTYQSTGGSYWWALWQLAVLLWEIWNWLRERRIPRTAESSFLCPENLAITGEGTPTVLGNTTRIRFTLVT
jgi:hypothetical protein